MPLQSALPMVLNLSGFKQTRVEVQSLSWQHVNIESLTFTLADKTRVYSEDIVWHFSPWRLLSGELGQLNVTKISVQLASKKSLKTNRPAALPVASINYQLPNLKAFFGTYFHQFRLSQVALTHTDFNANFKFLLNSKQADLEGELRSLQRDKSINFKLQFDVAGALTARFYHKQKIYAKIQANIQQSATQSQLTLSQSMPDMTLFSSFLPATMQTWFAAFKSQSLQANLSLPNQGVLPNSAAVSIQVGLQTRAHKINAKQSWHTGALQLEVDKKAGNDGVDFKLSAAKPLSASVYRLHNMLPKIQVKLLNTKAQSLVSGHCQLLLMQCQGQAYLRLLAVSQDNRVTLKLKPTFNWQVSEHLQLTSSLDFLANLNLADVPVRTTRVSSQITASLDAQNNWRIHLPTGVKQSLQLKAINGWQTAQPLALTWLSDWQGSGQLHRIFATKFEPLSLQLNPVVLQQSLKHAELLLGVTDILCRPADLWQERVLNCSLNAHIKRSNYGDWPVPEMMLSSELSYLHKAQALQASGRLTGANKQLKLNYKLAHKLDVNKGNMQLHLEDMSLKLADLKLKKLSKLSKLNILNGYANAQGWLNYQKQGEKWQLTPDVMLTINQLAGVYDNSSVFEDWNLHLTLHRPENKDYLLAANLRGAAFNPGVKIQQLLASGQMQVPEDLQSFQLKVHQINANLFAGRIYTPPFVYASKKKVNAISVVAEGLSLTQIAQLSKGSKVSASGTLDGAIPILLDAKGVNVPNAKLFARAPGGLVKFKSGAGDSLKQSNAVVGIAIDALANFHYNQLNIEANYQPKGDMLAKLKFTGFNPDFFDGQATNLNVNLTSNLLDLLESARIADNLIENIEDKYGAN